MKIERYLLLFILVLPVLFLRDFTPNNELKYLSIVDEALRDGHFFAFYNHGIPYADKPPLYFWIIMLCKTLWGNHSMFLLSLFSIIPMLVSIAIMDRWIRTDVSLSRRWSAALMLFTSGLFIGSGIVLRMDMLMCMFILLALYTFYKEYSGEVRHRNRFLLPFFIFMALFSKGPMGLLVPLLGIIVFLGIKKELRTIGRYLGWREWGILLFLCGIWFCCVAHEGGSDYLNNLLFHQTINRAVDASQHQKPFWYYGTTIWHSLAPWSLLYVAVMIIGLWKRLVTTDKEKFFLSIIFSTFIILSLFSSKLDIYLLPIFPFFTYVTTLLLPKIKERWVTFSLYIPVTVLVLVLPIMYIIKNKTDYFSSPFILSAALILSLAAIGAFILLYQGKLYKAINTTALAILVALFVGSFALPTINPTISFSPLAEKAKEIVQKSGPKDFYFYRFRSGENIDVYLNAPVQELDSLEDIYEVYDQGNNLIFIKQGDIKRSPELGEWIKGTTHTSVGRFVIVENL